MQALSLQYFINYHVGDGLARPVIINKKSVQIRENQCPI